MPFSSKMLDLYIYQVLVISLHGWRIGQRDCYIDLLLVSSALSPPNFILLENDIFYTKFILFSFKKLVFWGFRRYLGEIESKKNKGYNFSNTFFSPQSVVCQG